MHTSLTFICSLDSIIMSLSLALASRTNGYLQNITAASWPLSVCRVRVIGLGYTHMHNYSKSNDMQFLQYTKRNIDAIHKINDIQRNIQTTFPLTLKVFATETMEWEIYRMWLTFYIPHLTTINSSPIEHIPRKLPPCLEGACTIVLLANFFFLTLACRDTGWQGKEGWVGLAEYQEGPGRQGKGWGSLLGHGQVSTQSYMSHKLKHWLGHTHKRVLRFLRLVANCIKGEVA